MALKVLTVDDSKTIRMIVKKAFSSFECRIIEAENGVQGLAAAVQEKPDLIVLDITMPEMSGLEMLAKVRQDPDINNTPVIMLTAESSKDKVMEIIKLGVKNYIIKPFKGEQLIAKAQTLVALEEKKEEAAESKPKSNGAGKYFIREGDVERLIIPENVDKTVVVEVDGFFNMTLKEMLNSGINKFILDLRNLREVNMAVIKLLLGTVDACEKSRIAVRVAGNSTLVGQLKEFKETSEIPIALSLEEAKAAL